jgi:hypothetical protein
VQTKINILPIVLVLAFVNAAGFLLKYYGLYEYITIAGFRFHLSLVLPFIIVFRKKHFHILKAYFLKPEHKKFSTIIIWLFIPILLFVPSLLLLKRITIADPYRFYELGLSSIIDYPIYLAWNLPQLFLFAMFLMFVVDGREFKPLFISSLIILLFVYEFIPLQNKIVLNINFIFTNYIPLILLAVLIGIIIKYFSNIYFICITIFSSLWIYFLCFGSNSKTIVNLLFAANYDSWEGFFLTNKIISPFLLSGYLILSIILVLLSLRLKNKS